MDDDQFLLQMFAALDDADVVTIFFPFLRRALVVDTRHSAETGPLLAVVPQVGSMQERVTWVTEARRGFGRPDSIVGVPWLKSIRSLVEHSVLERIAWLLIRRGVAPPVAESSIARILGDLERLERGAYQAMLRGEGFETVWQAAQE